MEDISKFDEVEVTDEETALFYRHYGLEYSALYVEKYGHESLLSIPFLVGSMEEAEELYKDAILKGYRINKRMPIEDGILV